MVPAQRFQIGHPDGGQGDLQPRLAVLALVRAAEQLEAEGEADNAQGQRDLPVPSVQTPADNSRHSSENNW